MHAQKHAVFAIRTISTRSEAPRDEIELVAACESAAEAELIADGLAESHQATAVVGPEQPMAEAEWTIASAIRSVPNGWEIEFAQGHLQPVNFSELRELVAVDLRSDGTLVDRGILMQWRNQIAPTALVASRLSARVALGGRFQSLAEFLDDAVSFRHAEISIRSSSLDAALVTNLVNVQEAPLLALAIADAIALHSLPGSVPLNANTSIETTREPLPPWASGLGWLMYTLSLTQFAVGLWLLILSSVAVNYVASFLGLACLAVAGRRLFVTRWLSLQMTDSLIPSWPISNSERGVAPSGVDLAIEILLFGVSVVFDQRDNLLSQVFPMVSAIFAAGVAIDVVLLWLREQYTRR